MAALHVKTCGRGVLTQMPLMKSPVVCIEGSSTFSGILMLAFFSSLETLVLLVLGLPLRGSRGHREPSIHPTRVQFAVTYLQRRRSRDAFLQLCQCLLQEGPGLHLNALLVSHAQVNSASRVQVVHIEPRDAVASGQWVGQGNCGSRTRA
eukprot:1138386-Pelagomonas_calceolata.AAC.4